MEQPVVRKSISLSVEAIGIVKQTCDRTGLPFSTQLDQIIRSWGSSQRLFVIAQALRQHVISPAEAAEQITMVF